MVLDKNSEKTIPGTPLSSQALLVSHLFFHPLSQPASASQDPGPYVFHLQPTWGTCSCPKYSLLLFFFFSAKEQEYLLYSPGSMDSRKSQLSEILLRAMCWPSPSILLYSLWRSRDATKQRDRLLSGKLKTLEGEFANLLWVNAQQFPTMWDVCHMPGPS